MRYLITVAYDGSKFYGFQRLNDKNTVQKSIEEALTFLNKKPVEIKGAGRTDRGVHAYGQRCHFDLDIDIKVENLKEALNKRIGEYIYIKDCIEVDKEFHARFNVQKKTYVYKMNVGEYDPMLEDYTWQLDYKLDFARMKKAAKLFLGVHNFSAFVSGTREDYTAIIHKIKFVNYGNIVYIMFEGKSFYRYMVRNLVGALVEVGKGKIELQDIKNMLNSGSEDVKLPTASPKGLYLLDINY